MQKLVNRKGFTLVELVVVIAVLAILAGVGVVAYNGYIEYANKGKDRATVGEIMHALELADYADPNLFGDNGNATICIATNGTTVLAGNKSAEMRGALEDALGNLSTVKLSYSDWPGGIGTGELKELMNKLNSSEDCQYVKDYLSKDGVASFAGNIPELWSDVETLIQLMNADGKKDDYLASLVSFVVDSDNKANFLEALSGDDSKWSSVADDENQAQMGALIAGNYAFASWVESKHPEALSNSYVSGLIASFKVKKGTMPELRRYSIFVGSDEEYDKLVEEYQKTPDGGESQARIDAKAFLGLMEAGATYIENPANLPKDVDFTAKMDKVVNTASSALDKSASLEDLSNLAASLPEGGSFVTVMATKSGGTLNLRAFPPDANPRETSSKVVEPCELEHINHVYVSLYKVGGNSGISILNAGTGKANDSDVSNPLGNNPVVICTKDSSFKSCTFELLQGVTNGSITVTEGDNNCISINGLTITAVKAGTCKITLSTNADGKTMTKPFTINVH